MGATPNIDAQILRRVADITGVKEKACLVRMGLDALVSQGSAMRLAGPGGPRTTPPAHSPPTPVGRPAMALVNMSVWVEWPRRLLALVLGLGLAATAAETAPPPDAAWVMVSDLDDVPRLWAPEEGPSPHVRPTAAEAHSGRRSLAVTLANQGPCVRATWQTDVSDLRWSLDSRIRFWLKGSPLAGLPHGGIILVEAGGRRGGGNSHWLLPILGETYADPEWHLFESAPAREATNPDWAPDADARLDPARVTKLLLVAQEEAPPERLREFTVYLDDLQATNVSELPVAWSEARIEEKPDHVTPIWRGFKGRKREQPALVTFADVTGWRVAQTGGAEATLWRSEEEPCHEDLRYQAKVVYRSRDGSGRVELVPPEPIPVRDRFNAACAWVYGNNWSWVPDPGTPPVNLWLRFADSAGQRHRLDLGVVNFKFYGWLSKRLRDDPANDAGHEFWGGPADGRIRWPVHLEAIEVRGGHNPEPRTLYLESVAVFEDEMDVPRFHPERIADLPFPTTPDTILPGLGTPAMTSLAKDGDTFVFTAQGDETVVWRYRPQTGTLSDLSVEVAGRAPLRPCVGAGPVVLLDGTACEPDDASLTRSLRSVRRRGDTVEARWRASRGKDRADYALTLRARGKSLLVDWTAGRNTVTALRLGHADGVPQHRLFRVPYLAIHNSGPGVLLAGDTFALTLLDWYHTESSGFYTACASGPDQTARMNGGTLYEPLTDGSRNALGERQFINVSSAFEEVLPTIPNPPSTQAAALRERLYCHIGALGADRFDRHLAMWREYHRKGIRRVRVSHHEDSWTNAADVGQGGQEYTMCTEAAPEVGDAALIAYCQAMREMGYLIGLYENFTDYNPLGASWDLRNAARNSAGETLRVWPPTYALRPLKALDLALDYPRRVQAKFGTNTAYRDCHTAYPPWGQVDFQAGTPGAGKMATNFRAWGALLMDGHKAYGGPIFSEGGHHWFSAGLVDGNYAQMGIPGAEDYPFLVDFDLLRLHPLEADISMLPGWSWGQGVWHCLATTIAYGHIGFQPFNDLPLAARYYYLMQQLQSRYVMVPVTEIRYHHEGRFLTTSEALKADAHHSNQVRVRYANGLTVAVNGNRSQRWQVEVGGPSYDLSPFGWAAVGEGFREYCTEVDGRRLGFVDSPAYRFADGGGRWQEFGEIATDGAVAWLFEGPGRGRLIPLAEVTSVRVALPANAQVEPLDAADQPLTDDGIRPRREGDHVTLPAAGVEAWRVTQP
jgi:hypothetical protein